MRLVPAVLVTGAAALILGSFGGVAEADAATTNAGAAVRGPLVTRVAETGPSRRISGFRAFFNRRMASRRLRNVRNYAFFGVRPDGTQARIALRSAAPGLEGRSVRVRVQSTFAQGQFTRLVVRFKGRRGGLTDGRGRLIDGNRNGTAGGSAVFRFRILTGTSVVLTDHDGDQATVVVQGGGRADAIAPIGGPRTQKSQFWILDPIALRTTLNAALQKSAGGDGIVVIAEISGVRGVNFAPLSVVPGFRVNTVTLPNDATGR